MDDKKKSTNVGKDAVVLTASKIISTIITLVVSMLLSRTVSLEEYGTYSQLLLVAGLATSFFTLGLPSSINYFLARAETNREKTSFLSLYYIISTFLSIVMGAVLVAAIPLIEGYFGNEFIHVFFYFFAFYPWASVINSSIENVLVVYNKAKFLFVYRFLYSISLLSIVVVVYLFNYSFTTYVMLFVVDNVLFALSAYFISFLLTSHIYFQVDKKLLKQIFVFSIPIGLSQIIGTLDIDIDKLMIGYLMSTDKLAIYTNAAKELPISIVSASFTAVLMPKLAVLLKKNKVYDAIRLWGDSICISYAVIAMLVAGIFVYAEDVMTILYSEKYLEGVPVFRVYVLFMLLRVTYFGIILNAKGSTKKILYCAITALIINVVLNPVLFWIFGMIGPALATLFSVLVVTILQLHMTSKESSIRMGEIMPWKDIGVLTVINVVFSIVFYFAKQLLNVDLFLGSILESILLGIVWTILYFLFIGRYLLNRWRRLNGTAV